MRELLAILVLLSVGSPAWAALDVNQANAAELDSIKGIGPALSGRILTARKQGDFKDWADLMARVKGIRPTSAAKFSAQGLTVQGQAFDSAASTPRPGTQPKP